MMRPIALDLQPWKDLYKGETAWILGSGPSLDELNPSKVRGAFSFALNLTILMEDYRQSWWICRDGRCMMKWNTSHQRRCIGEDRRSVRTLFTDGTGADRVKEMSFDRHRIERVVNCEKRFFTGETILVFALQVADYLGFRTIILAGVDLKDPDGVAYAKEINWQSKFTVRARLHRHKRMRKEVAQISTSLNARVLTISPHLQDIIEKVEV